MSGALRDLPKVLLHDHLDGGVRPETVIELAAAVGYDGLPEDEPEALRRWFFQGESGSLESYLEAFTHTFGVMQTADALQRVAREAVEDYAADGVVYAEVRFAPSLHVRGGLDKHEVVESVLTGLGEGSAATGVRTGVIVDALRHMDDSREIAATAVAYAADGVVGFDLAGPEAGFPPENHLEACRLAVDGGLRLTLHAGEGDGPASIAAALDPCRAERIGHGVRIIEDTSVVDGEITGMGSIAATVHAERIPLEVCPTSNMHTNAYGGPEGHPLGLLHRAGFNVTLNTDNRLMSDTSLTTEFRFAVDHHDFRHDDLRSITLAATEAAFCDSATRAEVRSRVEAGYDAAG